MSDLQLDLDLGVGSAYCADATVSDDGRYRYNLIRLWGRRPHLAFVMLNPSTADGTIDDPTIRRCLGFARRDGYQGIIVRNLFAWRTPSPDELGRAWRAGEDIEGPENLRYLEALNRSDDQVPVVVAAWGTISALRGSRRGKLYADEVEGRAVTLFGDRLHRLDDHKGSRAPHPLYLRGDARIVRSAP